MSALLSLCFPLWATPGFPGLASECLALVSFGSLGPLLLAGPEMSYVRRCPALCPSILPPSRTRTALPVLAAQAFSRAKPPAQSEVTKASPHLWPPAKTLPQPCSPLPFLSLNSIHLPRFQASLLGAQGWSSACSDPPVLRFSPWRLPFFLLSADPSPPLCPSQNPPLSERWEVKEKLEAGRATDQSYGELKPK